MHREGQIPLTLIEHDRTSGTQIRSDSIALVDPTRELQNPTLFANK
jgi:hypothetical protein